MLTGSGPGTLTGEDAISTWTFAASPTYADSAGNGTLAFSGFATLQGGAQADTFTVAGPASANLKGGAGADVFDLSATLTGTLDGEADSDGRLGGSQNHGRDTHGLRGERLCRYDGGSHGRALPASMS